jgi:uncharacterized membrane protein
MLHNRISINKILYMNAAQIHLAINHLPVVLSVTGLAITLWGLLAKKPEIKKVGLVLMIATAVFAVAAFLSGDPAEDFLEMLPNFSESIVEAHEERGEVAFFVSLMAGAAALASLLIKQKKLQRYALAATMLFGVAASVLFLSAAHLGGLIRHEEIRPGFVAPAEGDALEDNGVPNDVFGEENEH